jgi:RNA polymerase sigma-70 factor (ECF subfamily)
MKPGEETALTLEGDVLCETIYRREHPRILRLCRLLLLNQQEAEEAAQDVFVRYVQTRATGTEILCWEAWLTRVAVNACRDRRRSAWWKWWRGSAPIGQEPELPAAGGTPEELLLSRERQAYLWRLFGTLPPRQREVFILRRLEGLSTDDTARLLGLSPGSIKRHLFHALRHLQKVVGES